MTINWNEGQLININPGDTARCDGGLNPGQLYALIFYNSAGNDAEATINVTTAQSQKPIKVTVAGTTASQGPAALCFVSGDDTNTVSAAMTQSSNGTRVQAFIGSVKMPVNTSGINNVSLPLDGQKHQFQKFTRFYAVPPAQWCSGQLQSNISQFISVQFKQNAATVFILNSTVEPEVVVKWTNDETKEKVKIEAVKKQTFDWDFQGNGGQMVWINADSPQNSESATISLQSLTLAERDQASTA